MNTGVFSNFGSLFSRISKIKTIIYKHAQVLLRYGKCHASCSSTSSIPFPLLYWLKLSLETELMTTRILSGQGVLCAENTLIKTSFYFKTRADLARARYGHVY